MSGFLSFGSWYSIGGFLYGLLKGANISLLIVLARACISNPLLNLSISMEKKTCNFCPFKICPELYSRHSKSSSFLQRSVLSKNRRCDEHSISSTILKPVNTIILEITKKLIQNFCQKKEEVRREGIPLSQTPLCMKEGRRRIIYENKRGGRSTTGHNPSYLTIKSKGT